MSNISSNTNSCILFSLIAEGNEIAFKILFEQYKTKTYAVAYKWTKCTLAAEEITQEVFISIWVSRAQLSAVKDATAYIYTIIYNQVKRYLKKEQHQNRILQLAFWNTKKICNITEETIQANETRQLINQALAKLTPQKKLIFNLSRQQGKTYSEIGESLNLSPHTVKSHLVKTIKFIRTYIDNVSVFLTGGILFLFF